MTGGASGIGREVAARLRGAGHDVVVWDLSGGDIACDVSDPEAVIGGDGANRARARCAHPDSGLRRASARPARCSERSTAEWQRVLAVNLTGTWLTIRAAARRCRRRSRRIDRRGLQHQRNRRRPRYGRLLRVQSGA